MAHWLRESSQGSMVPEHVVRDFDRAKDPRAHGIEYGASLIRELREIPGISGVNLSTTGEAGDLVAAIRGAG